MAVPNITLAGASQALDTSFPTIYSEFLLIRDETGVCRDCATKYTLEPHTGTAKNLINYGRVVAYNVADGADIVQNQALADTLSAYTPTEVAVQVTLAGSTIRRIADPDLEGRAAKILNNAYNLKEDADGIAQFSSYTATALGAANTVCSPGHVAAGGGQLRVGITATNPEPVESQPIFIAHPWTAVSIAGRVVPYATTPEGATAYGVNTGAHLGVSVAAGSTSGEIQQALLAKGIGGLGTLAGVDIRQDANMLPDSNDDTIGAFLVREGFVYVSEVGPRLDPDTSDKSMRGAVELNLWGSYTWGVYRAANYGVSTLFDSSKPTS
jgi:hypothetical protein